ncbi:4850_t:CDS:1, partial [Cetraspora pellucida]
CPISQQVWNLGYKMLNTIPNIMIPTSLNDIISLTHLPTASTKRAVE